MFKDNEIYNKKSLYVYNDLLLNLCLTRPVLIKHNKS